MKRIPQALRLTSVLVLAAMLIPVPTAMGEGEGAGGWVWSRFFPGEGHVVVVDGSGVYVGVRHFGDAYLLKYDADGQQLWTRGLGYFAGQLTVAVNASTLYAVGRTTGSLTPDLVLQALDTDGRVLWNHRFETGLAEEPVGVAADASSVYVVGYTHDRYVTNDPAARISFVQKYDKDGLEMWAQKFGSPTDGVSGVALDASGVYVVGRVANGVALWKFDLDGRYAWARQFKIGGGKDAPSVAADSSGIYVVGTIRGALPNQTSTGADDAFIRKYSSDGDELWTRQFGAPGFPGTPAVDNANAVVATEHGVYVGGTIRVGSTGASSDAFIRKFDANGGDLWGLRYRGASGAWDLAVGDTGIYLTGHSRFRAYLGRFGETPDPPRDLQATSGEAHVNLAWNPPLFDGGLPLKGYRIYRGTDPAGLEVAAVIEGAITQTYLDTDVTNFVTYYYAVAAVNEIGEGVWSPVVPTAPGTPPAAANPGTPPLDPILLGSLAVLGAALLLAIYLQRGARRPSRDPAEGQVVPRPACRGIPSGHGGLVGRWPKHLD